MVSYEFKKCKLGKLTYHPLHKNITKMKNQLFSLIGPAVLALAACQAPAVDQSESPDNVVVEQSEAPNYAAFNKNVEIMRSFFKAHVDEDINAIKALLADTLRWSPPAYNGNEWLGKEDLVAALQKGHDDLENIKFAEGIAIGDTITNGMWSGSVFPEESATNSPDAIRIYGTWTATHTESGKDIGVKWFALSWINDAGQIARYNDYFDVTGLAVQIAAE